MQQLAENTPTAAVMPPASFRDLFRADGVDRACVSLYYADRSDASAPPWPCIPLWLNVVDEDGAYSSRLDRLLTAGRMMGCDMDWRAVRVDAGCLSVSPAPLPDPLGVGLRYVAADDAVVILLKQGAHYSESLSPALLRPGASRVVQGCRFVGPFTDQMIHQALLWHGP